MAYRDINGNEYNSLEDIPEGAVFDVLNLSREDFTELPEKLATLTVRTLRLDYCRNLTSLKGLPKGLENLNCSSTAITSLEGLSEGLKRLDCSHCYELTSLKGLPEGLTRLDCRRTAITSLEGLPKSLKILECQDTDITSLEGVSKGIKSIECEGCFRIEYIPDYIPDNVIDEEVFSREAIAKRKENWRKKQQDLEKKKAELEKQKAEVVNRFMKVPTITCDAKKTGKVNKICQRILHPSAAYNANTIDKVNDK